MQVVMLNQYATWPEDVELSYPLIALRRDTWNDYGFETRFKVSFWPSANEEDKVALGAVKIAKLGMVSSDPSMRTQLVGAYPGLGEEYFSLGQSVDYYEKLGAMTAAERQAYGQAMRDIPLLHLDRSSLEREDVFRISFLRTGSAHAALDYALEKFGGGTDLIGDFVLETQLDGAPRPHRIPFCFEPDHGLPHRINVLVGINGVGKTQLMANLAVLLSRYEPKQTERDREEKGESFEALGSLVPRPSFYRVLAVSFSAFDDFYLPTIKEGADFQYTYCGLRRREERGGPLGEDDLASRIPRAVARMDEPQKTLFREALKLVMPGRDFVSSVLTTKTVYKKLSAGQRIVLNIVSDVVLNLRPRSLILFDEPEIHLHPQLLATLMSIISDLLAEFDSCAIIATHSPIVVQQVPRKRVHVIRRPADDTPDVRSPEIETFGENLSEIVRVVFDAIESDRDYQDVLDALLEKNGNSAEQVEQLFDGKLGLNAQIYLRSRGAAQ